MAENIQQKVVRIFPKVAKKWWQLYLHKNLMFL